jgi:hypothetical protein
MSECLHCDINEIVQKHLDENDKADTADVAGRMAESLAGLILMVPQSGAGESHGAYYCASWRDVSAEERSRRRRHNTLTIM